MNNKLLTASLALGILSSVPLAVAHDKRRGADDSHDSAMSELRNEILHTRSTYGHVVEELDAYGASRAIRAEMGQINAEINHVGDELASKHFDVAHVRQELAQIHAELHQVDESLHARGEQRSEKPKRGVTIRLPDWR